MSDKEKKRFVEMADRDKARFEAEMKHYVPPPGGKVKGRRRKKDPNAPKRALSAFFWFCNDERPAIRDANPGFTVGDVAKELGRRWGEVDEAAKKKYVAMAEKDKERYSRVSTLCVPLYVFRCYQSATYALSVPFCRPCSIMVYTYLNYQDNRIRRV